MSLLLLMGDSTPSIGSLFASGEAGLALDVETAYRRGWIFQDSAGATVAAAAGDPVGLILDTAKGGLDSLGSELVTNGGFDADANWTKSGSASISGGVGSFNGSGYLFQQRALTQGRWYRLEADISGLVAVGTKNIAYRTVAGGADAVVFTISANGKLVRFFLVSWSVTTHGIYVEQGGATGFSIDNISVREVPGNHAYQTTSGSRPALARTPDGGRRNLFTQTASLNNAYWERLGMTVTENTSEVTDPLGTNTATKALIAANERQFSGPNQITLFPIGNTVTYSIWAKKGNASTWDFRLLSTGASTAVLNAVFNFDTATFSGVTAGLNAASTPDVNGWYRLTFTYTVAASTTVVMFQMRAYANTATAVNDYAYFWAPQAETGSSATTWQRVGLTSDVTESGKRDCWGLLFDGSDDSLQTASVDFSAGDKMTVMAGVRKNVDTARATVCELTASIASNNGGFHLTAPNAASDTFAFESKGTSLTDAVATSIAAPATRVLTGIGNIAGDSTSLRVNGAVADTDTGDQGTGNYANAAVFIGSRSGSLRLNGIIYTLIVRGATTPTSTIADFEKNLLRLRSGLGPF